MKKLISLTFFLLMAGLLSAQNIDIRIEGRESLNIETGLDLDRLSMAVKGSFTPKLSFDYFQHFNRHVSQKEILAAADRLFLCYAPTPHWSFKAGKIISAFGSFEYDEAPIDVYFYTRHFYNASFFLPGLDVTYSFHEGKDAISAQVTKGCYSEKKQYDLFSYHLMWTGHHGWLNTFYSANLHDMQDGTKQFQLAFGHRVSLEKFSFDFDICNRYYSARRNGLLKSGFMMAKATYIIGPYADLQLKATYDFDPVLGNISQAGGAIEFYPYKGSRDFRIHLQGNYLTSENHTTVTIGLKWNCHIFTKG